MLGTPSLTAKAMLIGERVQNFRCRQREGSGSSGKLWPKSITVTTGPRRVLKPRPVRRRSAIPSNHDVSRSGGHRCFISFCAAPLYRATQHRTVRRAGEARDARQAPPRLSGSRRSRVAVPMVDLTAQLRRTESRGNTWRVRYTWTLNFGLVESLRPLSIMTVMRLLTLPPRATITE
jgi:hypothetical protein